MPGLDDLRRRIARIGGKNASRPHAHAAAYFLMHPPEWVHRHVETYTLEGLSSARRRLTVDLVLPTDPRAMVSRNGSTAEYLVPLARMNKVEPVPFIDLRDEQGAVVPLRTRAANAATTYAALERAIQVGTNHEGQLPQGLTQALQMLVYLPRPRSDVGARWASEVLADKLTFRDPTVLSRVEQIITHLVLNSIAWVVVRGTPGEHRVLKLAVSTDLGRPRLPARKTAMQKLHYPTVTIDWPVDGPIDIKETLQNLRAWLAARVGWDSVDITIRDPTIQDPRSYHLQIAPEAGLEVDRIEFAPDRETHQTPAREPFVSQGHFYLSDPGQSLQRAIPISVSIRVTRRGFLNVCAVAAALITALLWAYRVEVGAIDHGGDEATIAAAVLLIVPPFLVLMSNRSENPLISTLLSGLRIAAVTCMFVAALAAAAIAGVRPAELDRSLTIYAVVASVGCAVILVAWLGSFRFVRRLADNARCSWCGRGDRRRWSWRIITGLLLALAAGMLVLDVTGVAADYSELSIALVGAMSVGTLVSGWLPDQRHVPTGVWVLAVLGALAGATWCAATLWPAELDGEDTMRVAEIVALALAAWAAVTGFAALLAPVVPRAPARPETSS